jgi:hypothetical protein
LTVFGFDHFESGFPQGKCDHLAHRRRIIDYKCSFDHFTSFTLFRALSLAISANELLKELNFA